MNLYKSPMEDSCSHSSGALPWDADTCAHCTGLISACTVEDRRGRIQRRARSCASAQGCRPSGMEIATLQKPPSVCYNRSVCFADMM